MTSTRTPWTGAQLLLTAASVVVVLAGLKAASALVVQVLFAAMLAIVCTPAVRRLQRWRVPHAVAVVLVVVGVLLGLVWLSVLIGASLAAFQASLPRYVEAWRAMELDLEQWLSARFHRDFSLSRYLDQLEAQAILEFAGATAVDTLAKLGNVVVVILTMLFMLLEADRLPGKLRLALGDPGADLSAFEEVSRQVSGYLSLKAGLSLLTALLVAGLVYAVGVDFPVIWGVIAFFFNFVPNIGSIIAAVPAVMLALLQHGIGTAGLLALGYLAINMVVGNLLEPRVMGRRLGLSTAVVFLSLLLWGWVLGPLGMLLSVPLTSIVKIAMEHSVDFRGFATLLGSPSREGTA